MFAMKLFKDHLPQEISKSRKIQKMKGINYFYFYDKRLKNISFFKSSAVLVVDSIVVS